MYPGWASFAGVELINNERAAAYSTGITVTCRCPNLPASLGDAPYIAPELDNAPWYDPGVSESPRFWGVLGLDATGASDGTVDRQWTELLSDGGVPGALRRGSKEVAFKVLLIAADDPGLSYGMAWLASALRGSECGLACTGDTLCMYVACPTAPMLPSDLPGCASGVPDPQWRPDQGSPLGPGGNQLVRSLFDAVLLDGPTVASRQRLPGGIVAEVNFTIKAGVPYWYRDPVLVIRGDGSGRPQPGIYNDVIPNYDPWGIVGDGSGWREKCPVPASCIDGDPFCTPDKAPAPPVYPAMPPDPCFPNNPAFWANTGNPQGYKFTAARAIFAVPPHLGADWLEKVPIIRMFTGSKSWTRVIFRWYDNGRGEPCTGDSIDPCYACTEINIPYIPRNTSLVLDGRTRQAVMDCGEGQAGSTLVEPRMYGWEGGLFEWPVFDCSSAMCCEIITEISSVNTGAVIEIDLASRQDVI